MGQVPHGKCLLVACLHPRHMNWLCIDWFPKLTFKAALKSLSSTMPGSPVAYNPNQHTAGELGEQAHCVFMCVDAEHDPQGADVSLQDKAQAFPASLSSGFC